MAVQPREPINGFGFGGGTRRMGVEGRLHQEDMVAATFKDSMKSKGSGTGNISQGMGGNLPQKRTTK